MPISVASPSGLARLGPPLRALVRAALALERRRPGEISVLLADDGLLRDLNRRYRSLERATDVLSFGYEGPMDRALRPPGEARRRGSAAGRAEPAPPVTGDIAISLDRVDAQARRYRVSRGRELARLVVHGALHLAGLDHPTRARRLRMRRRERQALHACAPQLLALERVLDRPRGRARRTRPDL